MKWEQKNRLRRQIAYLLIGCLVTLFCVADFEWVQHKEQHATNETCPICRLLADVTSQIHQMLQAGQLDSHAFCYLMLCLIIAGIIDYHLIHSSLVRWKVRMDD